MAPEAPAETVQIERLGARGDGLSADGDGLSADGDGLSADGDGLSADGDGLSADGDGLSADGVLAVPGALPGETVRAIREGAPRDGPARARLVEVVRASPDRVAPFCPHFGACGGCAVQHLAPRPYAAWKRGLVAAALARAGLDAPLADLVDAHGAGRRRITLHVRAGTGGPRVGFMAARSHDLVPVARCPAAEPALDRASGAAAALGRALGTAKPLDVVAVATEGGLDLDVRGHGPLADRLRPGLAALADRLDLARLAIHGDVVVERRPPVVAMGPARVAPPAGGFLQATAAGEAALGDLVTGALGEVRRAADLFSGCGPFALRLAARAEVHAVDAEAAALASLARAARGLRRVTTERRDLFRRPLLAPELDRYGAVVLDPPRAGAEAQVRRLAESRVPVVAIVSCDAGTFARDAALLVGGGYRLERVTPVDQFKWTPHVEIVGVFRRAGRAGILKRGEPRPA